MTDDSDDGGTIDADVLKEALPVVVD